MNERERAAFYQAHKDDPAVWSDAEGRDPPRRRRGMSSTITIRLTSEVSDLLRNMAEAKGVSYSEIMRKALKMYAGSGRPLEDPVLTVDYSVSLKPKVQRPQVEYSKGFNQGRTIRTGSRLDH
jgi:hypothetical protein